MTAIPTNTRARHAAWLIVVALMGLCAGLVATAFARNVRDGPHAALMPALCALIVLEAMYSRSAVKRLPDADRWKYRVAEWIAIVVVLKVLTLALDGFGDLPAMVSGWMSNYLLFFLDVRYLLALVAVVLAWNVCMSVADGLTQLDPPDPDAIPQVTHEQVANKLLTWCLVIGLVAGAASLAALLGSEGGTPTDPAGPLVFFFVLSLALIAHTRQVASVRQWRREHTVVSPELSPRWLASGLGLVLACAFGVLLLPLGQSTSLLRLMSETLQSVLFAITYASLLIVQLLAGALQLALFILSFALSLLLGFPSPTPPAPVLPPPPPPPAEAPTVAIDPAIVELLRLLSAGVVVAIVVAALVYLVARRAAPAIDALGLRTLVQQLRGAIRAAWIRLRGALGAGARRRASAPGKPSVSEERLASAPAAASQRRPSSARERMRRYYALLLQRGARSGVTRRPAQTPDEYARDLSARAPDVAEEIDRLTSAFVEARYSTHEVSEGQVGAAASWFARIRQALRRRRDGGSAL